MNSVEYFKNNHYALIRNFIEPSMAYLLYRHMIMSALRCDYLSEEAPDYYDEAKDGTFISDTQARNDYGRYGDPIFDTLLDTALTSIEDLTGLNLFPTYSYGRLYTLGTKLAPHTDRPGCEISGTLCLGYDISNVKDSEYNWSIFVDPVPVDLNKYPGYHVPREGIPLKLQPGDLALYRGCTLEHWREPFLGLNQAQVFLHYNDKDGPFGKGEGMYDFRPMLGVPEYCRLKSEEEVKRIENDLLDHLKKGTKFE